MQLTCTMTVRKIRDNLATLWKCKPLLPRIRGPPHDNGN